VNISNYFLAALSAIVVAGCGGGGSGGVPKNPPPNALTSSVSSLALSVQDTGTSPHLTGTPRVIVVTNTASFTAMSVTYTASSALPTGTSITPTSCGDLAPNASCTLTATPGATASATPITLSISGTNTNTLGVLVSVLTYGSGYQGGYVFAMNDTTPSSGSVGGTVAAPSDQSIGMEWSVGANDDILGIYETSSIHNAPPDVCDGNSDGVCNTREIRTRYSGITATAAGLCGTANIGGFADWYLPAICELGYGGINCGNSSAPAFQNMQTNLVDNGNNVVGLSTTQPYWSSTEDGSAPMVRAWMQNFDTLGGSFQLQSPKTSSFYVRCARALTN
jgi:hypothetical protein